MDHPPPLISKISFSISFIVVFLIAIEVLSAIYLKISYVRQGGLENARGAAALSVYKSYSWAPTYWREEVAAFNVLYAPYVLWKRAPYRGETVTIDEEGLRLTAHSQCTAQNYTIWLLGGSTMWGAGAPDWLTIPSILAEKYEKSGKPVCVRNYGTNAWVNTQEVIELMLELKRAQHKPDLVIFYDGFNDTYSLYQSGTLDVPINNDLIRNKLEAGDPVQTGWNHPRSSTLRSMSQFFLKSNTAQVLGRLGARLQHALNRSQSARSRQLNTDQVRAQLDLAYLKNMELVDVLSRQYGFKFAFFWQPVLLVGNKHLSAEEVTELHDTLSGFVGMQAVFKEMYTLAQKADRPGFFDIADVLDGRQDTIYIDYAHLVPEGNRLVAERMYDVLHTHGM
jgi:lysophospholipase L1-like esterase